MCPAFQKPHPKVTAKERMSDSRFNNMVAGQGCAEEAGGADGGVAAHPD